MSMESGLAMSTSARCALIDSVGQHCARAMAQKCAHH
jgi:hypothetical protein